MRHLKICVEHTHRKDHKITFLDTWSYMCNSYNVLILHINKHKREHSTMRSHSYQVTPIRTLDLSINCTHNIAEEYNYMMISWFLDTLLVTTIVIYIYDCSLQDDLLCVLLTTGVCMM